MRLRHDFSFQQMMALAGLTMDLGKVQRATRHPDRTPETDTTHTTMLVALVHHAAMHENRIWREQPEEVRQANPGRMHLSILDCMEFALYHDYPEAIAGDVVTLRELSSEQKVAKDRNEAEAVRQMDEYMGLHRVASTIREYEFKLSPEAHFVHAWDKIAPRLTHIMDGCVVPKEKLMSYMELDARLTSQNEELIESTPGMTFTHQILRETAKKMLAAYRGPDAPPPVQKKEKIDPTAETLGPIP